MFKNKLKLTKKLARLVAVSAIPLGIVAASSHASAMNYPMLSKLLARKGSVPTAGIARRPVVQQPRVVEIAWHKFDDFDSVSDATLIGMAKSALAQNAKIKVSLTEMCRDGKFEFAKFLVENNLVDVNENLYSEDGDTPLCMVVLMMKKYYSFDQLSFIKFLVEKGARVNGGMHFGQYPLIAAFRGVVEKGQRCDIPSSVEPQMYEKLEKILDYLSEQGMKFNVTVQRNKTFLKCLMDLGSTHRSVFYRAVYDKVITYGGKSYI